MGKASKSVSAASIAPTRLYAAPRRSAAIKGVKPKHLEAPAVSLARPKKAVTDAASSAGSEAPFGRIVVPLTSKASLMCTQCGEPILVGQARHLSMRAHYECYLRKRSLLRASKKSKKVFLFIYVYIFV